MHADRDKGNKLIDLRIDWLPLLLMALSAVVFLYSALIPLNGTQVLGGQDTDLKGYFYPTRYYGFTTLQEGIMPLWNLYIYSGTPYIGTLQTAIFYPLNLVFMVLPTQAAVNWSIALHLFLSSVFTYYLLKYYGAGRAGSTIAAIVYTFSAPQVMHIYAGHLNVLIAMVWTPLMFLFLDRLVRGCGLQNGIFLSITIAFQLLAGQPQYLFYSVIALSIYLLFLLAQLYFEGSSKTKIASKPFLFAACVILGLTLSAIQILPTAEMTRYSTRENLSYDFVSTFSFPPENLITYLIPDFFGDMLKVPYWGKNYLWEMSAYVGIVPLFLSAICILYVRNRVAWFFAGLAGVSIILALGKYTPLLKFLYSYVPGFNLFRGNSKWIFLNAFSLAVLSGFGAEFIIKTMQSAGKSLRIVIAVSCLLLILSILAMYEFFDTVWFGNAIGRVITSGDLFNNPEFFTQRGFEVLAATSFKNSSVWTVAFLVSGCILLLLYFYGKLKESALKACLVAIIILDLFSFGMRYMVTFDSRETQWDKDVVGFLRQDKEPFRVVAPGADVNSGMADGMETLGGYDTIMVKRYSEFINFSQGAAPDNPELWVDIKSINRMTDLLNAKYLILKSDQTIANPFMKLVFDNGRHRIYRNLNAMPRAFVVHGAKVIKERDNIFREIVGPEFDPATCAVIEEEAGLPSKSDKMSPVPTFIDYGPNKIALEANLAAPGLLVLGDTYYPGWKAYVDGKETKIYSANYIMRAVTLDAGRHMVEFRYDPLSFKIGWIVSLTSLAFVAVFLFWNRRVNEKT